MLISSLKKSVTNKQDYTEKYKNAASAHIAEIASASKEPISDVPVSNTAIEITANIEETPVYKALKNYRYPKARRKVSRLIIFKITLNLKK